MKRPLVAAVAAGLALSSAACSSSGGSAAPSTSTSSTPASSPAPSSLSSSDATLSGPVGPGCADYASQVNGMANDPVAVAASHNPRLTALAAAVSGKLNPQVDLVDTLDHGEFTVFAPVDSAFAKVPGATLDKLKTDPGLLTKILTYHVLPRRVSPDKIAGEQRTIEGSTVTVAGTPDDLTVDGAQVICGGVHTANATVYLIDAVLTPATEEGTRG
jgi:uncharacterized surface protein with fasciclin (FAS1) repeats